MPQAYYRINDPTMKKLHSVEKLFVELLQVALANRKHLSSVPSAEEWEEIRELAEKHALAGVLFYAICQLQPEDCANMSEADLQMRMCSRNIKIKRRNDEAVADILNLVRILDAEGFDSCVLKGQGLGLLYPHGMQRMPGDIDIWVARKGEMAPLAKRRRDVVALCRGVVGHRPVCYHHTPLPVHGKDIEVHFTPSWMCNPWHNARLQKFFEEEWMRRRFVDGSEMPAHDRTYAAKGFYVPSAEMDAVFVLLHIYRHMFDEGVGLRQIVDYYYVLQQEGLDRERVGGVLKSVGLYAFAGAMMWLLREVLGMPEERMLCPVDGRRGRALLDEIMMAGNFGKYDARLAGADKRSVRFRFWTKTRRNLRFMSQYPSEALCSPVWKVWQLLWRRRNGWHRRCG